MATDFIGHCLDDAGVCPWAQATSVIRSGGRARPRPPPLGDGLGQAWRPRLSPLAATAGVKRSDVRLDILGASGRRGPGAAAAAAPAVEEVDLRDGESEGLGAPARGASWAPSVSRTAGEEAPLPAVEAARLRLAEARRVEEEEARLTADVAAEAEAARVTAEEDERARMRREDAASEVQRLEEERRRAEAEAQRLRGERALLEADLASALARRRMVDEALRQRRRAEEALERQRLVVEDERVLTLRVEERCREVAQQEEELDAEARRGDGARYLRKEHGKQAFAYLAHEGALDRQVWDRPSDACKRLGQLSPYHVASGGSGHGSAEAKESIHALEEAVHQLHPEVVCAAPHHRSPHCSVGSGLRTPPRGVAPLSPTTAGGGRSSAASSAVSSPRLSPLGAAPPRSPDAAAAITRPPARGDMRRRPRPVAALRGAEGAGAAAGAADAPRAEAAR